MNRIPEALTALAESDLDGWLLYDFRHSNPLLWRLLGEEVFSTRRVFLHLSREGQATLLVHHVDAGHFPRAGLTLQPYQDREELLQRLRALLAGNRRVAMEYSPMAALPVVSYVDGGTLELVRSLGVEVVSSAALAQDALCRLSPEELASHQRAAEGCARAVHEAFAFIGQQVGRGVTEHQVADYLRSRFAAAGLGTDEGPIVAVNAHAGDPHYEPTAAASATIRPGDWVLIDLWAKEPGGIYGDLTWVALVGGTPTPEQQRVFRVVTAARDAGVEFLQRETAAGRFPQGWEVDQAARAVIDAEGYGRNFTHRLGHSLGEVVHGYGANLDSYETQDTRPLTPGLAFTIEPGVYLPHFGIRSEINLYMDSTGPQVTSPVQREIVLIQ